MNPVPMPQAPAVVQLLKALTGKNNVAAAAQKTRPSLAGAAKAPLFCGFFAQDGENDPCAAVVVDLPLALAAAGALSSVPVGYLNEQLKKAVLEEVCQENLHEVMNVLTGLFNAEGAPHVRFVGVQEMRSAETKPPVSLNRPASSRLDLEVTIPPMPAGKMSILSLG